MKAFINRGDLTSGGDKVPIVALYDDTTLVSDQAHGGSVQVTVQPSAIVSDEYGIQYLTGDWRAAGNQQQIVSAEATRRIDAMFPEYSQRNSIAETNGYILQYGIDTGKWPKAARDRKAEIDRCWNYVNAVRSKATAMMKGALPTDPTANANWPTVISPYQPPS